MFPEETGMCCLGRPWVRAMGLQQGAAGAVVQLFSIGWDTALPPCHEDSLAHAQAFPSSALLNPAQN